MEKIESLQNARVKAWTKLHQKKERDRTGLFLIEGEHLIEEALKENLVETILTDTDSPFGFPQTVRVTAAVMHKISANVSSVHLIAVCRRREKQLKGYRRILMLDGIQDPGNLGTLVRTAVSFDFDGVICSPDTADLYNEKTIRSTQGAMFHIPVIYRDLEKACQSLRKEGVRIIATSLHEASPMSEIKKEEKMAFILGNEGQGVSEKMISMSDQRLFIEMKGFESLNVAVAGGIVMYTYRQ